MTTTWSNHALQPTAAGVAIASANLVAAVAELGAIFVNRINPSVFVLFVSSCSN